MEQANVRVRLSLWSALTLVFVGCAIVIFVQGLDNHFVSDDWFFLYAVSKSASLQDLTDLLTFDTDWFVRPAQWVATWVLFYVGGLNPLPYHLFSLIVDLSNALLLVFFSSNLYKIISNKVAAPEASKWSVLVLLPSLFLLSWRHHEAVFWYSSVNELLAAFFRLFSMLCVSSWLLASRRMGWMWIGAGVVSYALALSSKESAAVLPAEITLLLAFAALMGNRRVRFLSCFLIVLWFLGLVVVWLVPYVRTSANPGTISDLERSGLRLMSNASLPDLALRLVQFLNANYLGTRVVSASIPLMVIEIPILFVTGVLAIIRKRYLWIFAIVWTMIAAIPYVFITSTEAVDLGLPVLILGFGDRFLYYSAAGASLLLAVSWQWLFDEIGHITRDPVRKVLRLALAVLVVAYLGANTARLIRQEHAWEQAGQIGAGIVRQIQEIVPNPTNNSVICISDLPDNYAGAYVFRNGIAAALRLALSRDYLTVRATVQPYSVYQKPAALDTHGCTYVLHYKDQTIAEAEPDSF